jgi:hypothetical protein
MSPIRNALWVGALAGVATTVGAALFGKAEGKGVAEVLNTTSHIVWGEEALDKKQLDVKHTLVGVGINLAAVTGWAFVNELLMGRKKERTLPKAIATATATTAIAYAVDYHMIPKRLTPGFEEKLSGKALTGIYVVLAAALVVGTLSRD